MLRENRFRVKLVIIAAASGLALDETGTVVIFAVILDPAVETSFSTISQLMR